MAAKRQGNLFNGLKEINYEFRIQYSGKYFSKVKVK